MKTSEMKYTRFLRRLGLGLFLAGLLALPSYAADVYLVARETTKTLPDGAAVTVWGFAEDADNDLNTVGAEIPTVPGPLVTVPHTDNTLTIHLRNDLTAKAVSIVIPGQFAVLTPVTFTDSQGRDRVKSFTHETAPNGGIGAYTWSSLKPGTYLYQSGSHPAVQVPMGLYGGMTRDAAAGAAYAASPNINAAYDNEVVLIYSEIDPALNDAVAAGTYGTPAYPSAINYSPRYFLINGEPYFTGQAAIPAGSVNDRVLIRFLNAGVKTHVPLMQGLHADVIAEDGNLAPYKKEQYSVFLPAGKTRDAIFVPTASGIYPVYDRRFYLTDDNVSGGGMLTYLEVSAGDGGEGWGNRTRRGFRAGRLK